LLTLFSPEDDRELPVDDKQASVWRRQRKLMRVTEEAREQDGLLSQEDLARILMCDVRTIRRDIKELHKTGIIVATRGQQKDIGPGVTHRALAIRLWLEGVEPVAIARQIKHSIGAVENYLEKFKRVSYLRRRHFDDYQIALTIGISVRAAKTFVAIHHEFQNRSFFKSRMDEIELTSSSHYLAEDEKKDSTSWNVTRRGETKR
jgi:DNA-binding transcriptional regulator YhcF (GntR family)